MSRLLRILRLIMGAGRWNADALAEELECSRRTVYRDLQTLSMAGIPWYYDEHCKAYRVQPGFRFPGLMNLSTVEFPANSADELVKSASELVRSGEAFLARLREFCSTLDEARSRQNRSG